MKNTPANCAWCGKHFIKTRSNQECCGNKTCSTMNARRKKGQALYPNFDDLAKNQAFKVAAEQPKSAPTETGNFNFFNIEQPPPSEAPPYQHTQSKTSPFANRSMSEDVFSIIIDTGVPIYLGYVAKKLVSKAGIEDQLLNQLAFAVGGAVSLKVVSPRIKFWMKDTFKFHSSQLVTRIDELHRKREELLIKKGDKIDWFSGDKIFTALVGATIGGFSGGTITDKPDCTTINFVDGKPIKTSISNEECTAKKQDYQKQKRSNQRAGFLIGGLGGYLFNVMRAKQLTQEELDKINAELEAIEKEIQLLSARADGIQTMQKHNIVDMVKTNENGEQLYKVNEDIASDYITGRQYMKDNIPFIDFKGKYRALLGNPSTNFYMIVTGEPGHGKSTFCVAFAEYFQLNHGKTLYLPAEQPNRNKDFQSLLQRTGASNILIERNAHLWTLETVVQEVRSKGFKMVVFDSINYMNFTPNDIKMIRQRCPELAIVAVMQTRKDGSFRGSQEYKHDCDIFLVAKNKVLVPEKARGSNASIEIPLRDFLG